MRGLNVLNTERPIRTRTLGEIRIEADAMRGQAMAECVRGIKRLCSAGRARRQHARAA